MRSSSCSEGKEDVETVFGQFFESVRESEPTTNATTTRSRSEWECKFCGGTQETMIDGVWSCILCSTLSERVLDYGAEWRVFQNDDGRGGDTSRCSTLTSDLICPLGCVLRAGPSYGSGQRSRASRSSVGAVMMSKYQSWNALTYRERSLCRVFDLISCRTAPYNIAFSIVHESKQMYKQVSSGRIFRGDQKVSVVAACVYMALRSSHSPRSVCEVSSMFHVPSRSAMIRGCNLFHAALPRVLDSSRTTDFVSRFCGRMEMTPDLVGVCRKIADRIEASCIVSDCTPPSIVGAIIQMVNQERGLRMSRASIAEACMVSTGAIARCFRRISKYRGSLMEN